MSAKIISGYRTILVKAYLWLELVGSLIQYLKPGTSVFQVLRKIIALKKQHQGNFKWTKFIKIENRYFWDVNATGFPSVSSKRNHLAEINRIQPVKTKFNRFRVVVLGITKKCPMNCEHCYEWSSMRSIESISFNDLENILKLLKNVGVGSIQLVGGEPMTMVEEIVALMESVKPESDVWIFTSGYNMSLANSLLLKKAGITGVLISLDHYLAEPHNKFRGSSKAFEWALSATKNAEEANLAVAWSLCATNSFISYSNLLKYAEFASQNRVSFIQILEPMDSGHYKGKDVKLSEEKRQILEDFYCNTQDRKFRHFPIISYLGYHQRRSGCFGSGNRYLYIDTDGFVHGCPFCQNSNGYHVLKDPIDEIAIKLEASGCHRYKMAKY